MTKKAKPVMLDKDGYLTINPDGIQLPTASADTAGVVKVGDGLAIDESGVLSADGGGGGGGVFVVYFTTSYDNKVTTHDKSFSEIRAALNDGLDVVARNGNAAAFTQFDLTNRYYDYEDDMESFSFAHRTTEIHPAHGNMPTTVVFSSAVLNVYQGDTWTYTETVDSLSQS